MGGTARSLTGRDMRAQGKSSVAKMSTFATPGPYGKYAFPIEQARNATACGPYAPPDSP